MNELSRINWMAVIAATVVGFGLGAIWFNPKVLGKAWMEDLGVREETLQKGNFAMTMGLNFVLTLLTAFGLAWLIRLTGAKSLIGGTKVALLCAFAFVVTSYFGDGAYAQTKHRFLTITAGYRTVMIVIMGAILGYWR